MRTISKVTLVSHAGQVVHGHATVRLRTGGPRARATVRQRFEEPEPLPGGQVAAHPADLPARQGLLPAIAPARPRQRGRDPPGQRERTRTRPRSTHRQIIDMLRSLTEEIAAVHAESTEGLGRSALLREGSLWRRTR